MARVGVPCVPKRSERSNESGEARSTSQHRVRPAVCLEACRQWWSTTRLLRGPGAKDGAGAFAREGRADARRVVRKAKGPPRSSRPADPPRWATTGRAGKHYVSSVPHHRGGGTDDERLFDAIRTNAAAFAQSTGSTSLFDDGKPVVSPSVRDSGRIGPRADQLAGDPTWRHLEHGSLAFLPRDLRVDLRQQSEQPESPSHGDGRRSGPDLASGIAGASAFLGRGRIDPDAAPADQDAASRTCSAPKALSRISEPAHLWAEFGNPA
jgi:hypothetical protein